MLNFKSFITEAPFNDPDEAAFFNKIETGGMKRRVPVTNPDKKINFNGMVNKFSDKYAVIGEGSSRVAVKAKIQANVFQIDDLKKLQKRLGQVNTVFKIALNKKGMFQNSVEMQTWLKAKDKPYSRYLAPIIDWAGNPAYGNNIHYEVNHTLKTTNGSNTAPLWVQMPLVDIKSNLNDSLEKEFGVRYLPDNPDTISMLARNGKITEKQFNNFKEWRQLLKDFNLDDLHGGNLGVYKGRPVIIDYGYNDETEEIYWGPKEDTLEVTLNDQGEIEITV